MILGVFAYAARAKSQMPWTIWPVALRTGHVALGASILAISVIWAMRAANFLSRGEVIRSGADNRPMGPLSAATGELHAAGGSGRSDFLR